MLMTSSKKSKLYNSISDLEKNFEISSKLYEESFINEILQRYLLFPKEAERLVKRLNVLVEESSHKRERLREIEDRLFEAQKEIEQKDRQLSDCRSTIGEFQKKAEELSSNKELLFKGKIEVIKRLVTSRDQQLLRLDMAKKDNREALIPVFDSLCKESLKLLEHMGITEMPQFGSFDGMRHIVVETRPTSDSALHDIIAEVFRPGYYFLDEVFRPQEVIIYSYKAENEK